MFSGGVSEDLGSWVTCGHFLSIIEDFSFKNNLTEPQIKELCQPKLSDYALELFQKNCEKPWCELKNIMFENFPVRLTIREKVDVRKGLQQFDSESIDDFYQRCRQAQYLVSDDVRDISFEREVLLHFLIGLSPLIRDLVLATKCSSSNDYINEAKKYVQVIKEEAVVPDINIKVEVDPNPYPDYEEYDYKRQYEPYEDYIEDTNIVDGPIVEVKKKKSKSSKSEMENDLERRTCKECNKTFTTFKNKNVHVKNMHSGLQSPVPCKQCKKIFKSDKYLQKHIKKIHFNNINEELKTENPDIKLKTEMDSDGNQIIKEACGICEKTFDKKHSLKYHIMNVHLPSKEILCIHCEKIFKNEMSMREHVRRVHTGEAANNHKCEVCNETLVSKELLLDHQEKVHGHLKQTCEICNKVFLTMKILAVHIANKHCTRIPDKGFVCLYCNSVTKRGAAELGYHIMNKHFNQPNYQCDQCGKGFDDSRCLTSHIKYNHTTEKLFQCDKCAKNFKTVGLLNSHVKHKHEEQESATCKECNKVFKNSKTLKTHFVNMHSGAENPRTMYMCDDCGKSFLQKKNFKDHCLTHLSDKEKEQLKINCQFPGCDYFTMIKENLDSHIRRVHEKIQKYQCSFCAKSFFEKSRMVEHTNGVHLNLKPLQCDLCGFATAYRTTLQEHKKVSHGGQSKWRQQSNTPRTPRF